LCFFNFSAHHDRRCFPSGPVSRRAAKIGKRTAATLVTFDLNTSPALLREKAAAGEDHGGVTFVSSKSFAAK
jgi:hypothetical protein